MATETTGAKHGDMPGRGDGNDGAGGAVEDKYFLVIVGDVSEDAPRVIECDNLEAFATAVNEHVLGANEVIHAFGFKGARVAISNPAPVCAVEVNGKRVSVGTDERNFDGSGRIAPLRRSSE